MKRLTFILAIFAFIAIFCANDAMFLPNDATAGSRYEVEKKIKLAARAASVQILHLIPGLKVSFTEPLPEKQKVKTAKDILELLKKEGVTREAIEELLKDRQLTEKARKELITSMINEAVEAERTKQGQDKYEIVLTTIEKSGYKSPSKIHIPLGALAPVGVKFPERVLVVQKIEKAEITAWEKEYEKDVLTISETADVSPSKAKQIISTLRATGYSIFKEEVKEESQVQLLWFNGGWEDTYPQTLNWEVCIEGTETNIITGYDPRGILTTRPIPDDKRVNVIAGYLDFKDEFKPETTKVDRLRDDIKGLELKVKMLNEEAEKKDKLSQKEKEALKEKLTKAEEELSKAKGKKYKRDISTVTWLDIQFGTVKLERFWMISGGTGTYLGNMKVINEMWGYQSSWGGYRHFLGKEHKSVILTNAHVAEAAINFEVYISEDKEVMWLVYPGYQYVRYTQDSDLFGSPSQVLCIDTKPILSRSVDCALIVTTEVPGYKKFAAPLGNSDNIEQGDKVVMVGNPALFQKFATEGIISNKNYNSLKNATWFYYPPIPRVILDAIQNANIWIDVPIGVGGTSGSSVWALEGKEQGKIISLHAMGLHRPLSFTKPINMVDVNSLNFNSILPEQNQLIKKDQYNFFAMSDIGEKQVRLTAEKLGKEIFKDYSFEDSRKNRQHSDDFYK